MSPSWLPLIICLAGLGAMMARSLHMRSMGVNPWVLPMDDTAEGFLGRCFFGLVGVYLVTLVAWAVSPEWLREEVGTVPLLDQPLGAWAGITAMIFGMALILLAQGRMGKEWRIGIPENEQPHLVTSGVFGRSRNPVFLGMLIVSVGVAVAVPNALTWAALTTTYVALSVQIRLEDDYLQEVLGEDYERYRARVGRWFGVSKQLAGATFLQKIEETR